MNRMIADLDGDEIREAATLVGQMLDGMSTVQARWWQRKRKRMALYAGLKAVAAYGGQHSTDAFNGFRAENAALRARLAAFERGAKTVVADSLNAVSDRQYIEIRSLRAALSYFLDDDTCAQDHHGLCQTHGQVRPGECPMSRARALLHDVDA